MDTLKIYKEWLEKTNADGKKELLALAENAKEIEERFSMPLAFGTAGMRGEVGEGTFRMNVYTVRRATYGLSRWICSLGEKERERGVVISYDTRRFSYEFSCAAATVLSKAGIKAYLFENVRPVPVCSFAVRKLNAIAGIMITASHNPKEYNGYKVYGEDGAQMSPENTAMVVEYITKIEDYFSVPFDEVTFGNIRGKDNYKINGYITVIGESVDEAYYGEIEKLSLSPEAVKKYGQGLKLIYTPIHGAGAVPVTTIFKRMGINAAVVDSQFMPDTEFSTVAVPNPENADTLKLGIELAIKNGANAVIGTDPDCDRMGLALKTSGGGFVLLNGNQIGVLLMDYILARLKEENKLPDNAAVIKTIVTTTLADKVAESYGATIFNVLTGFKFIGEKIKEWEESNAYSFVFGYEESYGYLRGTHARDKDAVVASMLTAEMVCYYQGKGMSLYDRLIQIFEKFGYYYESNSSVAYKGLEGMQNMAKVMAKTRAASVSEIGGEKVLYTADYISGVKKYASGKEEKLTLPETDAVYYGLENGQFVCIRPSGTEPKLKVYVLVVENMPDAAKSKADRIMLAMKSML